MYEVTQMPCGMRVATAEMPQMRSVSIGVWVAVGSRYEPALLNGACHFIEHLLFKGTMKRSAREISESVEGIGGHLNAFTSEETTCFNARVAYSHFEEVLEVLFDMLTHSRFAPMDLIKEREVIKEEIAMYQDEPQHYVHEVLNSAMWPGRSLGRPITGTPQSLDGIDRSSLLRFRDTHYGRKRVVVTAAGRVTHGQVLRAVKRHAVDLNASGESAFEPAAGSIPAPPVKLVTRKTEQAQLALGIRTCSRHDPRRFALRVANTLLGENMSSRLFQALREDRGLVYSVYSSPSHFADAGDLVISAGLDTGNVEKALRLILKEVRTLASRRVRAVELERAKDYLIGQVDLSRDSTESQMNWLGEELIGHGRVQDATVLKRRISGVTSDDVKSVAAWFFRPENMTLAMVSELKEASELERLLRA